MSDQVSRGEDRGRDKAGMKEIRVGLVLFGGVSLAVYINGVTTELWNLLRASRKRQDEKKGEPGDKLDDTAEIYAELLDKLECLTGSDLRVVVDTVAGSSAGGINGATLAKAVVDGGDARVVSSLWIESADISELKAETVSRWARVISFLAAHCPNLFRWWKKRVSGKGSRQLLRWFLGRIYVMIAAPAGEPEWTFLKGGYFTRMIAETFGKMEEKKSEPLLPRRGSFDLYITRTDIYGWLRRLPVSGDLHDGPLCERTHAHVMHFRHTPNGGGNACNDFELTYAARSTGSFPFAFPPVNYESVSRAYREKRPEAPVTAVEEFERRHFPEHRLFDGFSANKAWMMDGGVLDNKPFTYVTRAIERKPAEHEVYRAVIYVEPNPEGEEQEARSADVPKPLRVGGRLFELLTHEPIYEDLQRLQDRNDKVEKIRAFLKAQSGDAERTAQKAGEQLSLVWPPKPADVKKWQEVTNSFAAKDLLSGYSGYVVLKARSSVRFLADVICRELDYPRESRQAFFFCRIMHAWFKREDALDEPVYSEDEGYVLREEQLLLLRSFDVAFRLRRLRALSRAINEEYVALKHGENGSGTGRRNLDKLKSKLEEITAAFQASEENNPRVEKTVLDLLRDSGVVSDIDSEVGKDCFDASCFISRHEDSIRRLCERLSECFRRVSDEQNAKMIKTLQDLPNDVSERILKMFATFPFVDLIAFPLMDAADIEDLVDVNIMRISPLDVPRNGEPPLKSRGLFSFKGFLCKEARKHDIEFGRLDGASRLVDLIMEAAGDKDSSACKIRRRYIKRLTSVIENSCETL